MTYLHSPIPAFPAFSIGQEGLMIVSVLSWLAVAFVLTSTHLSTVVGAWLLAHGVEMAKFRAARRRLTGDMQRLAETMIPPPAVEAEPATASSHWDSKHRTVVRDTALGYVGFCAGCGWQAVFPTLEEAHTAGVRHVEYMESLAAEAEADDRGI